MNAFQKAIGKWCRNQFGARDAFADALAIAEESGEVCRAILKRQQCLSGTNNRPETASHWDGEIQIECADVMIALMSLAENEGFDLMAVSIQRFNEVRHRSAK